MDKYIIQGPCRLEGEVRTSGSKNASLPIITATLLAPGVHTLRNIPDLKDIRTILTILQGLGITFSFADNTLVLDTRRLKAHQAPYELVKTMRASVYVMGPLLARLGKAEVALPGGCAIGVRPVDLHIAGFKRLGVHIDLEAGVIKAHCRRLVGTEIYLEKVSVGATANLLMAAILAQGTTRIFNASMDPDVLDLVGFLRAMGADIEGDGTNVITVRGRRRLRPADYTVMPDRIEAGTFLIAAAITGGHVLVKNCRPEHLRNLVSVLERTGARLRVRGRSAVELLSAPRRPKPVDIATAAYPGFPTDLQPQLTAYLSLGQGTSVINEAVFENRFLHIAELNRMGADIQHDDRLAVINGVRRLTGAPVMASDLRNGAALVLAGLRAHGTTIVDRIYHIDRGYERFEHKLRSLGARIERAPS